MKNKQPVFEEIPLKKPSYKVLEKKLTALTDALKEAKDAKEAIKVINKMEKVMNTFSTEATVISIRYSCNTNDPVIAKAQDALDEMGPLVSNLVDKWNKVLVKVPYRAELEKKFTPYYFQMLDNSLKSFDEKIIPELVQINKLTSTYDRILGSAQIEFRGGVYNLSQMGKFTKSEDRETRKEASIKVDEFFASKEEEIGKIYSELVTLRDSAAKKLGYKNYIELGYLSLGRVDYNAEMVKGYRKQIAETIVPIAQKLYKAQAKRIGIPFNKMATFDYNLAFLSGNPKLAGDSDYLVETATKMYEDLSVESGEFFHLMRDKHLLDLIARDGKQPGGYMTYMPDYKYPFIFSNFNGTEDDVNVLTHEVGHAFQGYLSRNIKPSDFQSPTLESCEIHSMSMEFFAWPYMKGFFGKDEEKYRYSHLSDAIEFLPYGITIDEFQHWVYEHPTATHEERCIAFKEIEQRYTPHKHYIKEMPCFGHGAAWIRQSHVFQTPFYYIDYTLAQVCAFQFLNAMNKDYQKAWKKYIKLCKLGGRYPFVTLISKVHLLNPFEDGNVKKIVRPLVKVLKSFNEEDLK